MSYRFLIVNTDYGHFLEDMYRKDPALSAKSFDEQYSARMQTLFGVNDFYSANLRKLGHDAIDLIYNNRFMQYAWAVENGLITKQLDSSVPVATLSGELAAAIFTAQVRQFRPDVIVNLAMETITSRILNAVKPDVRLIIGQQAAPLTKSMEDLSAYDLMVSSIPHYVAYFRKKGKKSEYFKLGFESTILDKVQTGGDRPIDIAFVGGFSVHHSTGADLFNYLADQGFNMALYGYGRESLSPKAQNFFGGGLYGKGMYELYSKAKIVINRHIDISGEYANNMRIYEAAGMGALLITDSKKNLGRLFDVGSEVIAYSSKQECAELVRFYLEHDDKREQIASNGQKRVLSEHTYYHRMSELAEIVDNYLHIHKTASAKSASLSNSAGPTTIDVSADSFAEGLEKLKIITTQKRFGDWRVKFNGLTVYCHDLLSLCMAAKDIFLHRIYDFKAETDNPVVIDGGGHIGLFTLFVKQKYPNARITIFEPDEESLRLLRKNLEANLINDVKIVEAGLYKNNGEILFNCDHSDGSSIYGDEKSSSIQVVRLSDYIDSEIDFLKLNIEGAESDVISEIAPKLRFIKEMVFEYHGFPEVGQNLHRILAVLENAGFRYMVHDFDSQTNPATKPPFRLDKNTRFFLLVYAKRLFFSPEPKTVGYNLVEDGMSLEPVSRKFGFDRGMPIDRYYIEKFLDQNKHYIRGRVLEIADNSYTQKYGSAVTRSDVLNAVTTPNATIVGDLANGKNIPESAFDCIILTQTIQFIYDVKAALRNAINALKPGGTLLLTTAGISQISRYDMERWGDYWRFTDKSLKMLLSELLPEDAVYVEAYGNVAVARAFLDGLAVHEIDQQVLDYRDNDYQVILTARVCKRAPVVTVESTDKRISKTAGALKTPLVLLYHRVTDDPIDSQLLTVSPANFEEHLKEMAMNYKVIPLTDLLQQIRQGELGTDTIALTFDDGYADNLTNALPLLEKYNLPATIFVTSGMVGSDREFWWDDMERLFLTCHPLPDVLSINDSQGTLTWDMDSPQARLKAYDQLCQMLRVLRVAKVNQIIDQLLVWGGLPLVGRDTHLVVNHRQLAKLSSSALIEIGSHTVSHSKLSVLPLKEQHYEIFGSKSQLESIIGKPARLFSYPYGSTDDFTMQTAQLVAKAGYDAGISNVQGNVQPPVDMYAIPRRLVRNWSGQIFANWMREESKDLLEYQTASKRGTQLVEHLLKFERNQKERLLKSNKS